MEITLKEYAATRGIAYEAVRRQLRTYANDLEGHIGMNGNARTLDDFAVEYLDTKRAKPPVVVMSTRAEQDIPDASIEEIAALKTKIEELSTQLIAAQQHLIEVQQREIAYAEEMAKGRQAIEQVKLLTERADDLVRHNEEIAAQKASLEERNANLEEAKAQITAERDAAKADVDSYTKTIFGLYKKKKQLSN